MLQKHRLLDGVELPADVRRRGDPGLVPPKKTGALRDRAHRHRVARQQWREERLHPVIVALRDRVELVVVASGTLQAHAQKHVAGDVGDVGEDVAPLRLHVALVVLVNPVAQKHRGNECVAVAGINLVPGQLLPHKLVVRFVDVEGADDIITVPPRLGPVVIRLVAVGVGVSHEVKPEGRLPLTVAWTVEQAIDQFPVGVRRIVIQKRGDLSRRRRQAGEVEAHAANQRPAIRRWGRRQLLSSQLAGDKVVDCIDCPAGAVRWNRRLAHRLERPPLAVCLGELRRKDRANQQYPQYGQALNHRRKTITSCLLSGEKISPLGQALGLGLHDGMLKNRLFPLTPFDT